MARDTSPYTEQLELLRQTPLFAGTSESTLAELARSGRFHTVRKGGHLFFQEEKSDSFFILRSGEMVITLNSIDGRELVIAEMRPFDCFGEVSLLTTRLRSAGVQARQPSTVLELSGRAFLRALDEEPTLSRRMLELLARRLRNAHERESALAFLDAPARVARVLREMDELDRHGPDKGYITLSQEEVALRTGLTRQTVAGNLGQWRRAGWLLTGRGRIMLLNRAALQRIEEQGLV